MLAVVEAVTVAIAQLKPQVAKQSERLFQDVVLLTVDSVRRAAVVKLCSEIRRGDWSAMMELLVRLVPIEVKNEVSLSLSASS